MTTNYRAVLASVMAPQLTAAQISQVLPGYAFDSDLGLARLIR